MATMRHIIELFAEITVDAELGLTIPTLLGSHQRAGIAVVYGDAGGGGLHGYFVAHYRAIGRATSRS